MSVSGLISALFAIIPILLFLFTVVSLILFLIQPKGSQGRQTWKIIFIISACVSGVFLLVAIGLMIVAGLAVANM